MQGSTYMQEEDDMTTIHRHGMHRHGIPWYLWPFVALWRLLATIVGLTGRFVAMVLGLVFILVGVIVSLTVVGAIVGIPMALIGLLLFLKGLF
jgi:hypothetical protein